MEYLSHVAVEEDFFRAAFAAVLVDGKYASGLPFWVVPVRDLASKKNHRMLECQVWSEGSLESDRSHNLRQWIGPALYKRRKLIV
jgi:hypothetical protein